MKSWTKQIRSIRMYTWQNCKPGNSIGQGWKIQLPPHSRFRLVFTVFSSCGRVQRWDSWILQYFKSWQKAGNGLLQKGVPLLITYEMINIFFSLKTLNVISPELHIPSILCQFAHVDLGCFFFKFCNAAKIRNLSIRLLKWFILRTKSRILNFLYIPMILDTFTL